MARLTAFLGGAGTHARPRWPIKAGTSARPQAERVPAEMAD